MPLLSSSNDSRNELLLVPCDVMMPSPAFPSIAIMRKTSENWMWTSRELNLMISLLAFADIGVRELIFYQILWYIPWYCLAAVAPNWPVRRGEWNYVEVRNAHAKPQHFLVFVCMYDVIA